MEQDLINCNAFLWIEGQHFREKISEERVKIFKEMHWFRYVYNFHFFDQ